jgi:Rrf2 family protein
MIVSTRGRYALSIMLDIAEHQGDGYVSLRDSAQRQKVSKKYLEQIIIIPEVSEMLVSKGGKYGGYRLARSPGEYTVGEVLRAAEGSICPVSCLEGGGVCNHKEECSVYPIWQGLDEVINNYLDGITLKDVLDKCGKEKI